MKLNRKSISLSLSNSSTTSKLYDFIGVTVEEIREQRTLNKTSEDLDFWCLSQLENMKALKKEGVYMTAQSLSFDFKVPHPELTEIFKQNFFPEQYQSNIKIWNKLYLTGEIDRFSFDAFGKQIAETPFI